MAVHDSPGDNNAARPRIVITGHFGQVGWWVLNHAPDDVEIVGIDLRANPGMDIRSPEAQKIVADADVVIHLAALIDVVASVEDPGPTMSTNVDGTQNLLDGMKPGARMVFVSSAAVYGEPEYLPIDEEHPTKPLSPYGESKLEAEQRIKKAGRDRGIEFIIIRPFNIYSSKQDPSNPYSGVISKFISLAKRGKPLTIYGDGEQTRDFIHAEDIARMLWTAARTEKTQNIIVNAGTSVETSVSALAQRILELAVQPQQTHHIAARSGEILRSVSSTRTAASEGFDHRITLKAGLRETFGQCYEVDSDLAAGTIARRNSQVC